MHAAEPLPHFVDDYLAYLYEVHPTGATMDGVHIHDDLLEDFRRTAIDSHTSALSGFARRLDSIPHANLPLREQVEHQIVAANIRARQFDLEATRPWERNPHVYADILASSLAAQAIFTHSPETDRACRVLSKLRQVPRLVQAARDNIKDPPAIFVKVGIDTWRGAMSFIKSDLPRAFSNIDDIHLLGDLDDACTESVRTIGAYVDDLENDIRPKAKGSFRLARFVVGIRLHTEDWSVEQGVRFFRDEAFLEEANARREAERGTFDPTYLVYSAGKLMLLKLRRDWYEQQGGKPSLRAFHDALLAQGSAPFWALRRLMLDGSSDVVLE